MTAIQAPMDPAGRIRDIGRMTLEAVMFVGDVALFACDMFCWMFLRRPRLRVLVPLLYQIGVQSISVVVVTGGFIGMVIAVQTYDQLRTMHLESTIGTVINTTLLRELGPVLAAVMLAGRVGGAMAAELGTMRVTEQIDALRVLGVNPVYYLVVPRFLSCFLLIPVLTVFADVAGIMGGWLLSTQVLGVDNHHYWRHSENFVTGPDILSGLFKSVFFGAAIAIIGCHRGFHCDAGAEGVGKAATEAFVFSFVSILSLDFFLSLGFDAAVSVVERMLG